jgi:hypothetical protein
MRWRAPVLAACCCALLASLAMAQAPATPPVRSESFPGLADLMGRTQLRHFKLWFAGRVRNWDLTAYELELVRGSFEDAARLFPSASLTDMKGVETPLRRLKEAVAARDGGAFDNAFKELTAACNGCHRSSGYGFIHIRVPTASPFSNQTFGPPATR